MHTRNAVLHSVTTPTPEPGLYRCTHRTVTTHDGVALAVRDHWPPTPIEHTVVLLHGLCLTQLSWENQINQLQRSDHPGLRIISYDHRGHGRSTSAPLDSYSIHQLASDLSEVLAALHVTGPTTLAGHSMGGMCALAYLARPAGHQPVQPSGLVLVATAAGRLTDHGLGRLLATPGLLTLTGLIDYAPHRAAEHLLRTLARPIWALLTHHNAFGPAERSTLAAAADGLERTPWTTALGFLRALKNYDQRSTLSRITAATTVISGGVDVLTPPAHSHELAGTIPNATHIHWPTAGHMLLHEAAHTVSDVISGLISAGRTATILTAGT
ncbi:alpha/beta fold hydrolase [Mycobacterium sp. DBP42]|uniref:alpha/beta fold hydrolase n=1 Tax=Mycobacterium sp. DBP42 TaxID=2545267 RepID=UPI001485EA52|nr:alpha/beta hydrolase [Mycobacterium sp. DBP42]